MKLLKRGYGNNWMSMLFQVHRTYILIPEIWSQNSGRNSCKVNIKTPKHIAAIHALRPIITLHIWYNNTVLIWPSHFVFFNICSSRVPWIFILSKKWSLNFLYVTCIYRTAPFNSRNLIQVKPQNAKTCCCNAHNYMRSLVNMKNFLQ